MNTICWKCGWRGYPWRIFNYQPDSMIDSEVFACSRCGAWYVLDPRTGRQPTPQEYRAIRANQKWRCDYRPKRRVRA
jgi:hypothetical protein